MPPMPEGDRHQLETALEKTRERLRRSRRREAAKDRRIERLRAELDKRRQYPKIEPT
jgi:chaperonin cofactor prefoldin